jgi:hypothetical protein
MKLLLTLFAALLYAVGWSAGQVSRVLVWCWSALAVGWDDARSPSTPVEAPLRRVA